PQFLNGELPVAPSAIAAIGNVSLVRPQTPYVTPRALDLKEIPSVIEAYRKGAENAKLAGFDGVELHGANGYLLDQFLQDGSNKRTDIYGGSIENRARLMLEVTDTAVSVWGPGRVGMHLSPRADSHSMGDSNLEKTFSYVAQQLSRREIAFICAREYEAPDSLGPKLKRIFKGAYVGNEKFTVASAAAALQRGDIDAVAFGKDFIANPDLVRRIQQNKELNAPIPQTFYTEGPTGYTDYPFLKMENKDPMHGVTLQQILEELVVHYGWKYLGSQIKINCFTIDPSINSSLKFLRRTPWARTKVENLYLDFLNGKKSDT
ncbi:MAG: VF530 family DNA-binding protein, partial [Bdellovibrionales bacterium]|nr:VF530 family DNA-binding protein [Bdellovibrionales bacterium]